MRASWARRVPASALLAALLWAAPAAAGPWTHDPGHGYAKAWLSLLPGVGWSEDLGSTPALYGYYQETFLGTYAELGVLPRLDATLHWTPVRTFLLVDAVEKPTFAVSVGEPALGLRWQAAQVGRFALALEGQLRLPAESNAPVATVHSATTGEPIGALRIANGVGEAQAGLSMGLGLDRLYAAWGLWATRRGGGFDSVLSWSAEIGTDVGRNKRWSVRLRLAGRHGLRDGSAPYHQSPSGIGNGTEYVGFTLEGDYRLAEGLWLGLSLAGGLGPVVRQTGGPQLALGISRTF